MTEENRRAKRVLTSTGDKVRRAGSATATYETKFRRALLIVAGKVLHPSVDVPPSLIAQATATVIALIAAEFGDELVARETESEEDTWPDDVFDPSDE